MKQRKKMKKIIIYSSLLVVLTGCARFSTTQKDIRDEKTTKITTKASSWSFFDSQSDLTKWKAAQTEKSQGAEVGGLTQRSSSTNAVNALKEINNILEKIP